MKLCLPEKLTLLALRAGPCTREQLKERFGHDHRASHLVGKGLAKMHDEVTFVITTLGREHCPKRRDGLTYQKGRPPKQSMMGASDGEENQA